MENDYPVNLRVDIAPEDGTVMLPGSITITRTTVSVFKLRESTDEEPLFIGVCSVPLIKFSRCPSTVFPRTDALLLTSVSGHLFINAALTAGVVPPEESGLGTPSSSASDIARSHASGTRRDSVDERRKKIDNPGLWTRLRLEFRDNDDCDRCVEALLARHAEELNSRGTSSTSSLSKSHSQNDVTGASRSRRDSSMRTHSGPRRSTHSESTRSTESSMRSTQEDLVRSSRGGESRNSRGDASRSGGTPLRSAPDDSRRSRGPESHSVRSDTTRTGGTPSRGGPDDVRHSRGPDSHSSRSDTTRTGATPLRSAPDDSRRSRGPESHVTRSETSRSAGTPLRSAHNETARNSRSEASRSGGTPLRSAPDDSRRSRGPESHSVRSDTTRTGGTPSRGGPDDVRHSRGPDSHSSHSELSRSGGTPPRSAPDAMFRHSRGPDSQTTRSEASRSVRSSSKHSPAGAGRSTGTTRSSGTALPAGAGVSEMMHTCRSGPTYMEGSCTSSNARRNGGIHHGSDRTPIRAGRGPADGDSESDAASSAVDIRRHGRSSVTSSASRGSGLDSQPLTPSGSEVGGQKRRSGSPADFHTPNSKRRDSQSEYSQDSQLTPRGLPNRSRGDGSYREADSVSELRTPRSSLREGSRDGYGTRAPGTARDAPNAAQSPYNIRRHSLNSTGTSTMQTSVIDSIVGGGHDRGRAHSQATSARTTPYNSRSPPGHPSTGKKRTELQYFLRCILKFMHHRLHFMQYLHKEVVFEAYLHEEARLLGGRPRSRSMRRSSRATSASHNASRMSASPRRSLIPPGLEEAHRLREIEDRLREVENLHRTTELERAELERRQREFEEERRDFERRRQELAHQRLEVQDLLREVGDRWRDGDRMGGMGSGINRFDYLSDQRPRDSYGYGEGIGSRHSSHHSRQRDSDTLSVPTGEAKLLLSSQKPPALEEALDEADYPTAFVDRYVYGDEWRMLLPKREMEVRFNALVDTCIALKLPRRLVTILTVSVEQPGLRVTAEVRHNPETLSRDVLTRRFTTQPLRFLQRLYDLRHYYAMDDTVANAPQRSLPRGSRGTSRGTPLQGSRVLPGVIPRVNENSGIYDESSDDDLMGDNAMVDPMARMREFQRGAERRRLQRELESANMREKKQATQQKQRRFQQLEQLEQEESMGRSSIVLAELQTRRSMFASAVFRQRPSAITLRRQLEEKEQVERSLLEVGYVRQTQVLMQAHRRNLNFVRLLMHEAERRLRHVELEREARMELDIMMNPTRWVKSVSLPEVNERTRRQRLVAAEMKQRMHIYANIRSFVADAVQSEIDTLISDEMAARLVLGADEMKSRIDLYSWSQAPGSIYTPRSAAIAAAGRQGIPPQALHALFAEESVERVHLGNDELRRRHLYQREYIITTEDAARNDIELEELDEHVTMLDGLVQKNRKMLERRRQEQQRSIKLLSEEQYYRKSIINDEQDEFEEFMEQFDAEINDMIMTEASQLGPAHDIDSPSRRRRVPSTPRQAKLFHYMSFVPEDMDHVPTANLAIEGMLGCSINKNLEVTCIARPLPKAEAEELQFQAGDMILDVAGYSLHSLSHLREVLANRAMQIQHEAREEFDDVPEDELLTNPALQKYIEVLCEHHNFLVQVLRGCDIFQIIVKS
ncbi:hypothetical protein, conserved [Trypanosoma brucei brucei TREU927]|uniref:Flagellar attachment zone protein 1 conserved domain-containing protein n=1 Tax=Trypanosoma brucei brucei (strain 927/4 GUTat10.1) TaxID=185431 RepID=Q4GYE7_TRYB2|nr:hypothetical protein, conserved [Trypanosoma brucei brucei TREU927]CAJ16637.1 hypothetical protein, conserved [Trypanosoma brucei brucei TREU927]